MANSNNSKGKASSWTDIEFVNVKLTEADKAAFEQFAAKPPTPIGDLIGQVMVDNYRLSCGWDDGNQCFIATFTGKQNQKYNASRSMSSRSDDWYEAIVLNCFKHFHMFHAGKWSGENEKNNWG